MGISEEDYAHLLRNGRKTAQGGAGEAITETPKKRSKMGNKPVLVDLGPSGEVVNGHLRLVHLFQSQREADYYGELVLRRKAGDITKLRLQEPFALIVQRADGQPAIVGEWLADFEYEDAAGRHVVDAKGMKTAMYLLKKKIVEACHGIRIEEV